MRKFEILLAFYLLLLGVAVIVIWLLLIGGGQVPNIERDMFSLIFHWSSELFLAITSIAIGIGLLKYSEQARMVLFYGLGMAVCSTINAAYYYSDVQPDSFMTAIFVAFTLFSIFFFVIGLHSYQFYSIPRQALYKFGLFNLGLFIYLALNIAGDYGQKGVWSFFIILVFLIIAGLSTLLRLVRSSERYGILQTIEPE